MSTNEQIASVLKDNEEAHALAAVHDTHTLMGLLKELYERLHGAVAADLADWHWHATTLKNSLNATGEPHADDANPAADGAGSEPQPGTPVDAGEPPAAAPVDETQPTPDSTPTEPVV